MEFAEVVLEAHESILLPGKMRVKPWPAGFGSFLGLGSERVNVNVNKNGYLRLHSPVRVLIRIDLTQTRNGGVRWDCQGSGCLNGTGLEAALDWKIVGYMPMD